MKTCKKCNKEIADNSLFCPYCGNKCDTNDSPSENVDEAISDFEQDIERKRKITRIATIALPILILVIGGYFLLNHESETIIESPSDKQQQVDSVDEEIAEEEENDIESQLSKISY